MTNKLIVSKRFGKTLRPPRSKRRRETDVKCRTDEKQFTIKGKIHFAGNRGTKDIRIV